MGQLAKFTINEMQFQSTIDGKKKSVKQNFLQKKSLIKFINNSFSTIFINEEKNQTKPDHTFLYNSLDHRYLTEIHLLKSTH
jgi:hypothetical protein